ncbi:MAG: hypothetical protein IJS49_01915 [Paludibacteraceae bacterium]|nr:hypothetical protein [Paludibacteraceae bacterium]
MKKYINAELAIISLRKNDIVTMSNPKNEVGTGEYAPGRRDIFDPYDPYNAEY